MIDGINQLPAQFPIFTKRTLLAAMAYLPFIVDLPIKNGASFHSYGTMIDLSRYILMVLNGYYGILHSAQTSSKRRSCVRFTPRRLT